MWVTLIFFSGNFQVKVILETELRNQINLETRLFSWKRKSSYLGNFILNWETSKCIWKQNYPPTIDVAKTLQQSYLWCFQVNSDLSNFKVTFLQLNSDDSNFCFQLDNLMSGLILFQSYVSKSTITDSKGWMRVNPGSNYWGEKLERKPDCYLTKSANLSAWLLNLSQAKGMNILNWYNSQRLYCAT